MRSAARTAGEDCLADEDATDPLAELPDGDEIWNRCLAAAQSAATRMFESLGGELVDRPEDDPSVDEQSS